MAENVGQAQHPVNPLKKKKKSHIKKETVAD